MASEPKVGEMKDGSLMWLGNCWHSVYRLSTAGVLRIQTELSAAREMREVLREIEFLETGGDDHWLMDCPSCHRTRQEGHAPDCRLARLIGGGE